MIHEFEELHLSVKKCRAFCPWTKEQTLSSFAKHILSEAEEVVAAAQKNDIKNIKEELGDLLWNVLMTAHIAEESGIFTVDEVLKEVVAKMRRRKPFVFDGRQVTLEEAGELWVETKVQEKLINGKTHTNNNGNSQKISTR